MMLVLVPLLLASVGAARTDDNGDLVQRFESLESDVNRLKLEGELAREEIANLREELQQLADVTSERKRQVSGGAIAFSAFRNDDAHLVAKEVVVFDVVTTNAGNGYSGTTGQFTAPEAGFYFFTVNILSLINNLLRGDLVHNSTPVGALFVVGADSTVDDQSTTSVAIHCAAGDKVWFESLLDAELNGNPVGYTQFTGFLIARDADSELIR